MNKDSAVLLKLAKPLTVVPAKTVSQLTLQRIVDLPGERVVRAFAAELPAPVVLWSGDAYDAIGDWTQDQANARLVEIISQ